jgi:predicted nucleotidyltransferase
MDFRNPLRLITPTLDADVLRVVGGADRAFTGSEIQRVAGVGSRQGIRLVLIRLVDQGIVDVERAGRSFLYRLNRDHLAAHHIVALATLRTELLQRLRAEFAEWLTTPPVAATLFGSAARGDARETSDIDLLVIRADRVDPDDAVWRDRIMTLEQRTSRWTGNDARVLEYSERDFIALRHLEPVLMEAADGGILLFGAYPATT